jgi:hypothetical protein
MRGHHPLLFMRRGGYRPAVLWVDVGVDRLECWRDWAVECPHHAHVEIACTDDPSTLDLRFAVGLDVFVTQLPPASRQRAIDVALAIERHGSASIRIEADEADS